MSRMSRPIVPEQPVDVLTQDQLRALLRPYQGRDLLSVRDTAIIRLFCDTGMRLVELAGLSVTDSDLELDVATIVLGKGRRNRSCPFGQKTGLALGR